MGLAVLNTDWSVLGVLYFWKRRAAVLRLIIEGVELVMKPLFSASVIMIYVPSSVTELLHRDPERVTSLRMSLCVVSQCSQHRTRHTDREAAEECWQSGEEYLRCGAEPQQGRVLQQRSCLQSVQSASCVLSAIITYVSASLRNRPQLISTWSMLAVI